MSVALESGKAINKTNFVWPQFLSKRVNVFCNQPVRLLMAIFLRNFDSNGNIILGKFTFHRVRSRLFCDYSMTSMLITLHQAIVTRFTVKLDC